MIGGVEASRALVAEAATGRSMWEAYVESFRERRGLL
jgi:hypothetical protein